MVKNLWGDLSSITVVRSPKTILLEQATLLTEATSGLLVGHVVNKGALTVFRYTLDVVVPALNNYSYQILEVSHPLEGYPVELTAQRPRFHGEFPNEEQFEGAVAKILSSPEVRSVLSSLKSQVYD